MIRITAKGNKRLAGLLAAALLLIALFLNIFPLNVSAEKSEAKNIMQGCSLIASENAGALQNLWDSKVTTVWKASAGSTLTIKSPAPIGGLYILWDRDPVAWTLSDPKETIMDGGADGFLHEYVPVSTETAFDGKYVLTMTMHEAASIADLYVLSPGVLPSWVQTWQPMLEKADMLAFSTHADDELLWFGGTLPMYAGQYKKKVQVAYLIYHGAARNEYFRNHELLDGLWTVGVTNYPMICRQFEDYYCSNLAEALKTYDEDAMREYAVMLLRRFKPEVVVTQDENGEYGHGAHRLAVKVMKEAVHLSSDPSKYPASAQEYGTWNIKKCYLHLYSEGSRIMPWEAPLPAFQGKTGLEMAVKGYQCHKSQLKKWFRVEAEGSQYDCRKFGLYYTTVGPDKAKNDFLENTPAAVSAVITTAPVVTTTTTTTAPPTTATTTTTTTTTTATSLPAATTTVSSRTSVTAQPVIGGLTTRPSGPTAGGGWKVWLLVIAVVLLAGGAASLIVYLRIRRLYTAGKQGEASSAFPPRE